MKSCTSSIDISWPISSDMTAYKDRAVVQLTSVKTFPKDHVRESLLTIGSHSGTHVDAPAHFLGAGTTIDQIPLEKLIGPCVVIDLTQCVDKIIKQDLVGANISRDHIVLLKTKNSAHAATESFNSQFVYLAHDAAQFLVECGARAVGIDYLGIERNQPGHETHEILFKNNIVAIEGLRLGHVQPGSYTFVCLPLLISGCDAAPARAVLITID